VAFRSLAATENELWATAESFSLLQSVGPGRFQLTDRGRNVLAGQPAAIDVAFLESRFAEMSEFRKNRPRGEVGGEEPTATYDTAHGTWSKRAGVGERVRETMEQSNPNEATRRAALELLALIIDNADQQRPDAWCIKETDRGLRVLTGRLLACEVSRSNMRVSVIGPIGEDIRRDLGADAEKDEDFKKLQGGVTLTFPIDHAANALSLLKNGLDDFVEMAMARVRSPVDLEDHVPEAVVYISSVIGRELPQPQPVAESKAEEFDEDEDDVNAKDHDRLQAT
jgi:hypothetical protein